MSGIVAVLMAAGQSFRNAITAAASGGFVGWNPFTGGNTYRFEAR